MLIFHLLLQRRLSSLPSCCHRWGKNIICNQITIDTRPTHKVSIFHIYYYWGALYYRVQGWCYLCVQWSSVPCICLEVSGECPVCEQGWCHLCVQWSSMCIVYTSICILRLEIVSGECPVWEEGWPGPGQTFTSHPHVASTRAEHSVNWIQNRSRNKWKTRWRARQASNCHSKSSTESLADTSREITNVYLLLGN